MLLLISIYLGVEILINFVLFCHLQVCRQRLDDPNLKYFAGPPPDAVEELIALTDPSLTAQVNPTEDDGPVGSEWDHRPILRLTQFAIYDEPGGHFCAVDGGAIEANHFLYASGYVKAIWCDSPEAEGGIPTKEIGPINEWFISGFDGGEKAMLCML